jgi:hypothetical protein
MTICPTAVPTVIFCDPVNTTVPEVKVVLLAEGTTTFCVCTDWAATEAERVCPLIPKDTPLALVKEIVPREA